MVISIDVSGLFLQIPWPPTKLLWRSWNAHLVMQWWMTKNPSLWWNFNGLFAVLNARKKVYTSSIEQITQTLCGEATQHKHKHKAEVFICATGFAPEHSKAVTTIWYSICIVTACCVLNSHRSHWIPFIWYVFSLLYRKIVRHLRWQK